MIREITSLGAQLDQNGANFAIFSAHADGVELVLLDEEHRIERTIDVSTRTGDVWHAYVAGVCSGQRYAYRVHGPWAPDDGLRFNAAKLLLDPYAREISRMPQWHESLFGHDRNEDDRVLNPADSAPYAPIGVVVDSGPTTGAKVFPRIPWRDTVIYETHVKGLSVLHPDVPPALRGTYLGAASAPVLSHLKSLGVTTVELLPVHAAVQDERLVQGGLSQYWGYNPLSYFAPDSRFAAGDAASVAAEFRAMVDTMHDAGLEVILDVVYNHTGEGNHVGPTLSWRGIDNASYYVAKPGQSRFLYDSTGCGNTLRAEHPFVRRLIMDSMRYWVEVMNVDGFRFDLTSTLLRERCEVNMQSGWLQMVQQDPILSRVKLIAEPWDVGRRGYRLGACPAPWREWNDKYRDAVRRYWRGESGMAGELATRLAGSSDLFKAGHRRPSSSINYVTSHDGFTLLDLVSYRQKRNLANLEDNKDGTNANYSQDCGKEGPSADQRVVAQRNRLRRSLLTTLFVSQGVPMLLGGDELGRTQLGNNNAYCQDNEISWYDWDIDPSGQEMLDFVRQLIAFRKAHPSLRRNRFLTGEVGANGLPDAVWWHPEGRAMQSEDWAKAHAFGMWLAAPDMLLICFNPTGEPVRFKLSDDYVWSWGLGWGEHSVLMDSESEGSFASVDFQSVLVLHAQPSTS